jgi:AcrR family transcriptional regulator
MVTKKSAKPPAVFEGPSPVRARILEAAFSAFMERGFAETSTLEIATRARASKRELYAEFGSKSGILQALIAATSARMRLPLATAEIRDRDDLGDALTAYGTMALAELTSPHVIAVNRLAAGEAGRSSELGRILEENGREPNRKALIDLLAKAQAAGVVGRGEPDVMAGQFFSLLLGDLMLRLMLGVTPRPAPGEIKKRAQSATEAVLALHAAKVSAGEPRRRS